MKNTKRLLSIILSVIMMLSMFPISVYAASNTPSKPTVSGFSSTTSTVTVNWKKVTGAKGYVLYRYNTSTKKYYKISSTTKLSYKVSNLKAGTSYSYAVKAYKVVKKKTYYSSYSSRIIATTLPSKPIGLKATTTYNSVSLSWSKVTGATGYYVYKYNSSTKKYTKLLSTTKLSCKLSSLAEDTSYKYAVKAYKTLNKKNYFSSYSTVLTAKTKVQAVVAPINLKVTNIECESATISFTKASNAQNYIVEYSDNKDFSKSLSVILTNNDTSCTLSLKHNKTYYVRAFSTRTVNGKIYTSSATKTVKFTTPFKYEKTVSTVDESKTYQTITGFGVSGCWWAQRVGRWSDEEALIERDTENEALWTPEQTKNALKYLYDAKDGIGLNIYRYNLGTDSYKTTVIENKWNRTEGFLDNVNEDGSFEYNWNKDKSAMNTLSVAKDLAGDDLKVVLFANSPPTQLTENGLACCDDKGVDYWDKDKYKNYHQNLPNEDKSYIAFAKYLTDVADHFVEDGYNVVDVSPVNEPQTAWSWGMGNDGVKRMSQEGCHYTPVGMAKLAAACAIAGEGKPYTFSMFDSGAADGANEDDLNCSSIKYLHSMYNTGLVLKDENGKILTTSNGKKYIKDINKEYYTSISLHSYWCDKATKKEFADYVQNKYPAVKSFACTEYCQMTNDVNTGVFDISSPIGWWQPERNGLGIEYGVQLARVMYDDLTTLNATEWDWWTGCSGGYYPDGLVYVDYKNPDNVQTSKRLWAMGNYSKFIQEGATRVDINEAQSELLSTAYKNPDGSLVIVYVNLPKETVLEYNVDKYGNKTPKTVLREGIDRTVNISASGYSDCSVYVTSDKCDLENTENCEYSLDKSINIPGQSVVTVVLK